jgi:hypothetical protein
MSDNTKVWGIHDVHVKGEVSKKKTPEFRPKPPEQKSK